MHRVDADGYTTVSGDRRFIDRALPTEEGTVDGSYWSNAVQEEIAQVVERAGLTLRVSGAADETADWGQLEEAIFDSQALSNGALANDLSLAHFSQGQMSFGELTFDETQLLFGTSGVVSTHFHRKGIRHFGSGAPGTIHPYMRPAVMDITSFISGASVSNAETETASGHTHVIGKKYDNTQNTNIEDSTQIFDAKVSLVQAGGNTTSATCEVEFGPSGGGGSKWEVVRIIQTMGAAGDDLSSASAVYLTVYFDGNYLVP